MLTFLIRFATSQSSSYPIVLTRLGGPRSRPNPHFKICGSAGVEPVTSWSVVRHAVGKYYLLTKSCWTCQWSEKPEMSIWTWIISKAIMFEVFYLYHISAEEKRNVLFFAGIARECLLVEKQSFWNKYNETWYNSTDSRILTLSPLTPPYIFTSLLTWGVCTVEFTNRKPRFFFNTCS